MKIQTKLSIIVLLFGIMPVVFMFWLASNTGLVANRDFHYIMAMSLMAIIFIGFAAPNFIMQWFLSYHLKKMQDFCLDVKKGHYDVRLAVPNAKNDSSDENELVSLMRDMNWMVYRIKVHDADLRQAVENLKQSQVEIQSQKSALEVVNAQQLAVQLQLERRTHELNEVVAKIRNLLDNAGQGFLSFGEDYKVIGEYSAECVLIFNREIDNEAVPELFYPEDKKQQTFLEALFDKILHEEDDYLRDTYFSLLPEELVFDDTYIQLAYKLIRHPLDPGRKEILLILTDITERREMEQEIQKEKNVLSMVVRAVTHFQEVSKAVQEYTVFCQEELPGILLAEYPLTEKLSVIFRTVHTWKGTFGQLGMQRLAANLHALESELAGLRDKSDGEFNATALADCFVIYPPQRLYSWLEEEMNLLTGILGDQFFLREETVLVQNSNLQQLEDKIQGLLAPCQARQLVAELRKLRYKPFAELLSMYPDYIVNLAANQDKKLQPLQINGSDILVDPAQYYEFAKSLIHVFRNAVAHGLETPDERLAAGKAESGLFSCTIQEVGSNLTVTVADDGRGIDPNHIREIAVTKGISNQAAIQGLADEEVIQFIFADGFSSAASANELSGRGVGLYAVLKEVENLGGHIAVASEVGKGTQFSFVLPLMVVKQVKPFAIKCFAEQVLMQAQTFLLEKFRVKAKPAVDLQILQGAVPMYTISTFIDVKGSFAGRLMVSANEGLVQRLADRYLQGNIIAAGYQRNWLESALSEFFNTIVGNSLQLISSQEDEVTIGTPVTIWAEGASANYAKADTHIWQMATESGNLYFGVISFEREKEDGNGACISC
ncbi:MAG TPA: ATP-binding protein [Negativicutes bacterium]